MAVENKACAALASADAARSAALEEHLAPITDVNQFARVLVSRSISDYGLERIAGVNSNVETLQMTSAASTLSA